MCDVCVCERECERGGREMCVMSTGQAPRNKPRHPSTKPWGRLPPPEDDAAAFRWCLLVGEACHLEGDSLHPLTNTPENTTLRPPNEAAAAFGGCLLLGGVRRLDDSQMRFWTGYHATSLPSANALPKNKDGWVWSSDGMAA